jgi:hypothetical protein
MNVSSLLERAKLATVEARRGHGDQWSSLMPVIHELRGRGFRISEAARWIAEQGAIEAKDAGKVAQSYRQREMRRKRRVTKQKGAECP